MERIEKTNVFKTDRFTINVLKDDLTNTYSIGYCDGETTGFKWISKELYDMIVKELGE